MIVANGHSNDFLNKYRNNQIQKGLGLNIYLDDYLLFKRGQLNFILGHDNVGKSYWIMWYFLSLATQHDLKFTLFMDENSVNNAMRDLVRMYLGKKIQDSSQMELDIAIIKIESHFNFIDNSKRYTPEEILNVFRECKSDVFLIDPFNALKMQMSYSSNYDVLNELKMFCKTTKSTIYINAHPSSQSGRRMAVFPKGHDYEGQVMPPMKDDIEGGKAFSNKADDFLILHRFVASKTNNTTTLLEVRKVKDTDTGGQQTLINNPIAFDFNRGNGFLCGGQDSIKRPKTFQTIIYQDEPIKQANLMNIGREVNEFKPLTDDQLPF